MAKKFKSQEQFGREAEKYVTTKIHASTSDLKFVKNIIQPEQSWEVLDIATGAGHLAHMLAPYVKKIIASDITKEMLERAKNIAVDKQLDNFFTETIDVHSIPYPNSTFELVTSRIAPHHFDDVEQAIAEMVRVLKPQGMIFIQDTLAPDNRDAAEFFNTIEKLRDHSHVRDLSMSDWVELLQQNGCKIVETHKKPKTWNLKLWTNRMSTPWDNIVRIIDLLEAEASKYNSQLNIIKEEPYLTKAYQENVKKWTLIPNNGYLLAEKQ